MHRRQGGFGLVLRGALGQQVQLQPVLGLQVDHQAVGSARRGLENRVGHGPEVDHDMGIAAGQAFAGADEKWHARPAPVGNFGAQGHKGLCGAARGNAAFLQITRNGLALARAGGILPPHHMLADGVGAPGLERLQHLEFLVANGVGAGVDGRLHANGAQQLQGMVLHHVAQGARLVVEGAAGFHAQFFGDGDLDVGNGFAPPQGLEQCIAKAHGKQVLHRRLA